VSFPVVVGSNLLALVSAQSHEPKQIPVEDLSYLANEVKHHAISVGMFHSEDRIRFVDGLSRCLEELRAIIRRNGDLVHSWPEIGPLLQGLFSSDGACLCIRPNVLQTGMAIEEHALVAIERALAETGQEPVTAFESLRREVPEVGHSAAAGALAVPFWTRNARSGLVLILRDEHIHEVTWGGNPNKPVEYVSNGMTISPRHSFARWVETRVGYCRPWDEKTRLLAFSLLDVLQEAEVA
jgi:light-regulated signal transduction histidine kinase (bacteriophytochrome)